MATEPLSHRYPRTRVYLVVICTLTFILQVIQLLLH
jgi:hypothetical protein